MLNRHFIHPEAFFIVFDEYKRLHISHPEIDNDVKWGLARDKAWALSINDTMLLKQEYGLK